MKRAMLLALCGATAACGSANLHKAGSDITPAQKAKAKQVADQCLKKGGGFKAEFRCAVPPGHGLAFVKCVLDNAPKSKTQATIEADLITCGEKWR